MSNFFRRWLLGGLALAAAAWVLPGVQMESVGALLVGAAFVGLLNALVKPILLVLTLPLTLLSLGLFYFVLNAILFYVAAALVPGFEVEGFAWALLGSLLYSLFMTMLGSGLGSGLGAGVSRDKKGK